MGLGSAGAAEGLARRVVVRTLGCKVNQVESEKIATELTGEGVAVSREGDADVIVVNTCTVTGEADAKARKAVRRALADGCSAVVVTGCLAALEPDRLRKLGPNVVVEPDKTRVAGRVAELVGSDPGSAGPLSGPLWGSWSGSRTRAMLKIQDGCDSFCSYCIVPYARGVPRSVPLSHIREEALRLLAAGVREIVLTGINLGRYSSGENGLPRLIEAVADAGVERLRLSSIEPVSLDEELIDVLSRTAAVCPHLHVPLQSGSDRVLRAMRRGYDVETYAGRVRALRAALPNAAVTTDVIAGFPGESDRDAESTRRVCEELGFARLHVFRYSERAGTAAASRDDTVAPAERARRAAALRETDRGLRARYATSRQGNVAEVLVESVTSLRVGARAVGTSEDYLKVAFDGPKARVGDIVRVRLGAPRRDGSVSAVVIDPGWDDTE